METDNDKLSRILDKLRKLMDLKNSALECGETGEANAAAAGITRLLTEYDLTLQDIPDDRKIMDPIDVETVPFRVRYMQYPWYWTMMDIIAEHNNAEIIRTRYMTGKRKGETEYSVVGRKRNREVVLYLISFLANRFVNIGRGLYPDWKLNHIRTTGCTPPAIGVYMKSFLYGCVIGLNDKLRQEREQFDREKVTALVRTEKQAIDSFMADMNVSTARSRKPELMREAVTVGIEEGRNIDIHKGVTGSHKRTDFLQ